MGAYGAEVASHITAIDVLDRRSGQVRTIGPEQAGFGYRTSALKRSPDAFVVLAVRMRLARDPRSAPVRMRAAARGSCINIVYLGAGVK